MEHRALIRIQELLVPQVQRLAQKRHEGSGGREVRRDPVRESGIGSDLETELRYGDKVLALEILNTGMLGWVAYEFNPETMQWNIGR